MNQKYVRVVFRNHSESTARLSIQSEDGSDQWVVDLEPGVESAQLSPINVTWNVKLLWKLNGKDGLNLKSDAVQLPGSFTLWGSNTGEFVRLMSYYPSGASGSMNNNIIELVLTIDREIRIDDLSRDVIIKEIGVTDFTGGRTYPPF
jgi:hypothetical protein